MGCQSSKAFNDANQPSGKETTIPRAATASHPDTRQALASPSTNAATAATHKPKEQKKRHRGVVGGGGGGAGVGCGGGAGCGGGS